MKRIKNNLNILYHLPFPSTIYAYRTIYHGFKSAFEDLGLNFRTLTAGDNLEKMLCEFEPDIILSSVHNYYLKYLDMDLFNKARKRGAIAFMLVYPWNSQFDKPRINEGPALKNEREKVKKIQAGLLGDVFYNSIEQGDPRMEGFEKVTGYKHLTLPLAADKIILKPSYDEKFKADISFIGTLLPEKRQYFKEYVFPLRKKHDLKLYGQDWTPYQRLRGWIQRGGQYFNIPYLRNFNKPKLALEDEAKIYNSSLVSINVHEDYQKKFGGDCNERTFKIPLCEGFEITDNVSCIGKYFKDGEEIVIAKNKTDWFDKIEYYIKNPEKRIPIIEAGRKRVLAEHTYHNRVETIIKIYNEISKENEWRK